MTFNPDKPFEVPQHVIAEDVISTAGFVQDSITDGPGMRFTLFVQGCPHGCRGCHNPQTHPFEGGKNMSVDEIFDLICKNPLTSGVTFSGGEPLCQAKPLSKLACKIKEKGLELAVYTGYTWEQLRAANNEDINRLISLCDVMVDGEFKIDQRNLDIKFKGSENQRIIDVKLSLENSSVVLKQDGRWN